MHAEAQYFYSFKVSYDALYEASQIFCFVTQCNQNKPFGKHRLKRHTRIWMSRNIGLELESFLEWTGKLIICTNFCCQKIWIWLRRNATSGSVWILGLRSHFVVCLWNDHLSINLVLVTLLVHFSIVLFWRQCVLKQNNWEMC